MVGHIYKLEYALYPNFTIIDFQSTVRAIDSFVYIISVDITGLERFISLSFSWRLCEGRTELKKFQEPTLTYLYPYYCTTNLICDRHVTSILAPRYVSHVHVFTKILSVSGETPRGRYRLMK